MFDIGFWELIIIAIIGLVVLGPERLPTAIRTVSGWIRTAKGMASSVKQELEQEVNIEKMHQDLKKAEQLGPENLTSDIQESLRSLQEAARDVTRPYEIKKTTDTPVPQDGAANADKKD